MLRLLLICGVSLTQALDNGLALTPPMGWLTWQRYRCLTDCTTYPDECISEKLIKRTADMLVDEGYLEAGYDYIGIDDCWMEKNRSASGKLVPDRERFPSGMKMLGKYVHSKGLKFGIYQDYGTKTCAGYPGVMGHEQTDVDTLVSWGVDYIKLDGCYSKPEEMKTGYPDFGRMLNKTGRPVLYSCSWPAYLEPDSILPNYTVIAENCNLWRNWDDIEDSWQSLLGIMNWFGDNQERLAPFAGPGHWNDPDMLLVGNYGLSLDQARVQMAVWAVLAAPLLISADLARMRPEFKEILLNRDIIAVNQDPLGKQGLRVYNDSKHHRQIWTRKLSDNSYAVAFVSTRVDGVPYAVSFSHGDMKIPAQNYRVQDLYNEEEDRKLGADETFTTRINPTGVKFFKFIPVGQSEEDFKDPEEHTLKNVNFNTDNDLDKTVVVV
ncbi:alpha-N-acetylgalactosaminidase [Cydia amplana]|uniref:alpha-N-acetylgalactosaminidase n=1 Tax=Cydia amplana TaxID=1869771 RepID=UPI002FE67EC1